MLAHFRNVFPAEGVQHQEDMKGQYLEYGPFDLNPTFSYGDTAYTRLEKNFSDSFARTALAIVEADQPFTNIITTRTHMMTTGLIAAYLQVEQPNDAPFSLRCPAPTDRPGTSTRRDIRKKTPRHHDLGRLMRPRPALASSRTAWNATCTTTPARTVAPPSCFSA